jgi:transmembrane sensor
MDLHNAIKYLTNTDSAGEHKEFDKWLALNSSNQSEFDKFRLFWEQLGDAYKTSEVDIEKGWKKVRQQTIAQNKSRVINIRYVFAVAAAVVLMVSIATFLFVRENKIGMGTNAYTIITSDNINEFTLADGSIISLNKQSQLKISGRFNRKFRTVELQGEAFFDVARNEEKPFVIYTGNTAVEVLGTSFNIRANEAEKNITVTVNSGQVMFYSLDKKNKSVKLEKGEEGNYNKDLKKITEVTSTDPNYLAWKTGVLQFNETPVREVLEAVGKVYGVSVVFENGEEAGTFTGKFDNVPLQEVMDVLSLTLDIKFEKNNDKIVVLRGSNSQ